MMYKVKIFIGLYIAFISSNAWSQGKNTLNQKSFYEAGYTIVYGNQSHDIEDFLLFKEHKVLLLKKSNGAMFYLLNNRNTKLDSKSFNSAPSNIKFWQEDQKFYYHSMLFYKSDLCDLNFKPGLAIFNIENEKIHFDKCLSIKDLNELVKYSVNNKYSVEIRDKEKCKKRKKKTNSICQISLKLDGKELVERTVTNIKSEVNAFLPFVELNKQLYIFDAISNQLYIIDAEKQYQKISLKKSPLYHDTSNSIDSYELIADQSKNNLYLFANRKIREGSKRKNKTIIKEQQIVYKFNGVDWQRLDFTFPSYCYKLKIKDDKVHAIFEVLNENRIKRKMLYQLVMD